VAASLLDYRYRRILVFESFGTGKGEAQPHADDLGPPSMKRPTRGVRFERPAWAASLAGEEDTDLLARVAAGDRGDPLCELYGRYEARLYGYGLRLLGDAGLAEELVQETILRVWRTAGSFDAARGSVATFNFTLARRIAIDLWRRPSSRPFRSTLDPSRVTVDDPAEEVLVGLVV
jgi:hypothetical protein